MSYTIEQAEEVFKDWNDFHNFGRDLSTSDIEFLDHKFGVNFKVGKWYKYDKSNTKVCYKGANKGFGTWYGVWNTSWHIESNVWQPMTDEEVLQFLTEEAEKRYNDGDFIKSVYNGKQYTIEKQFYIPKINSLRKFFGFGSVNVLNLKTGEWAKVVKKNDPVKEQIEKLEKELETLKNKYNEQKQ